MLAARHLGGGVGHGIRLWAYGLRTAWFAAENKLRDVFYGFEYYIFHIHAAAAMKPDPDAGMNMDSFPRMSPEIVYHKPRTQMGRAAVQVTR